jgi:hypothetical protein
MAAQDYYDTNIPDQTIDVSASQRKFQSSIIVTQDPQKSGILSFLEKVEETTAPPPTRTMPQTVRPTRRSGGY